MSIGTDTPEITSTESRADYRKRISRIPGLSEVDFRRLEGRAAQEHRKTPAQLLQSKITDIELNQRATRSGSENIDPILAKKANDATRDEAAALIRSISPPQIKAKTSDKVFNNLESEMNRFGLSLLTPDGHFTEEDERRSQATQPADQDTRPVLEPFQEPSV